MISTAVKPSLSLFCRQGFKERSRFLLAGVHAWIPYSPVSTQGRLLCTQHFTADAPIHTALQVHILTRTQVAYPHGSTLRTQAGLRKNRVEFPMPLGVARNSQARR